MIVKVTEIQWDTDGEDVELPKEVSVIVTDGLDEAEILDRIEEALDKTGWCFKGYLWRQDTEAS